MTTLSLFRYHVYGHCALKAPDEIGILLCIDRKVKVRVMLEYHVVSKVGSTFTTFKILQ